MCVNVDPNTIKQVLQALIGTESVNLIMFTIIINISQTEVPFSKSVSIKLILITKIGAIISSPSKLLSISIF